MARPEELLPGDILLYRNFGWLGDAIAWFEWNSTPGEALQYSHIALVLNEGQAVEMNPPVSRVFPLSEVPWDRVDVYRLDVLGISKEAPQVSVDPFLMTDIMRCFQFHALARLGESYAFQYIAQSAFLGVLARVGLPGVAHWLAARPNPAPEVHKDVCSTWAEDLVTDAVQMVIPNFDLFPDLGSDRARPSDWPRSPYVKPVS